MRINEIFASIQGEGLCAGEGAIFVRFQGCPLRCDFCDTKRSWEASEGRSITLVELVEHVFDLRRDYSNIIRNLVLTGGEPLYGDNGAQLALVINALSANIPHMRFIIETSGTVLPGSFFPVLKAATDIVISPKYPRPEAQTFLPVKPELVNNATAFKFLVDGTDMAVSRICAFFACCNPDFGKKIYIQPVDFGQNAEANKRANQQAVELAMTNGWNVSVQMHKVLGVA